MLFSNESKLLLQCKELPINLFSSLADSLVLCRALMTQLFCSTFCHQKIDLIQIHFLTGVVLEFSGGGVLFKSGAQITSIRYVNYF